jgi:hypothetical protein
LKLRLCVLLPLLLAGALPAAAAEGTYTYHHDNSRTGWNQNETVLTVANVASKSFGLVGTLPTDSVVYAEPLFVPGVTIGGVAHDLVIAVTENDTAYAFDAQSGKELWKHSALGPHQTAQPISSVNNCPQITPSIGISSTPVVDTTTQSLYFVAKIADASGSQTTYHAQLHSLALTTGAENRPVAQIGGAVKLSNGSTATFGPQWQQQRPGLLLDKGVVYVGFGSSCDENAGSVFGWMFAYNATSMKRVALFNTETEYIASNPYYLGSIWQGTYAPAADEAGNIYFATGNGAFDANVAGGRNYGESVLELTPGLTVADSFTPYNEASLTQGDEDVGSAGVMLVPQNLTGSSHLAVAGGKNGEIFLMNRDALGGYTAGGPDKVYQEIAGPTYALYGGPALYDHTVYYGFNGQPLVAYALTTSPQPKLTATSQTASSIGGVIPAVSSNGTNAGTAVLWATSQVGQGSTFSLMAYDATNLGHLLFSGAAGVWNAQAQNFLTPTIGNGRVFVPGAGNGVAVFGLAKTDIRSRNVPLRAR